MLVSAQGAGAAGRGGWLVTGAHPGDFPFYCLLFWRMPGAGRRARAGWPGWLPAELGLRRSADNIMAQRQSAEAIVRSLSALQTCAAPYRNLPLGAHAPQITSERRPFPLPPPPLSIFLPLSISFTSLPLSRTTLCPSKIDQSASPHLRETGLTHPAQFPLPGPRPPPLLPSGHRTALRPSQPLPRPVQASGAPTHSPGPHW